MSSNAETEYLMTTRMSSVITEQPASRRQIPIGTSGNTPTSYLATIDDSTLQKGGLCYECMKPVVVFIMFLIAPPIAIAWFLCDACCTFAGRKRFINVLKECYYGCCFKLDCLREISLYEAITRYEEDPPLEPRQLVDSIIGNKLMIAIMEELHAKLPDFFFTFFPSGSLRERYAKMLPSTSILASDYDVMLVPDAISVAKRDCANRREAFIAEKSPHEHEKGFLWLHLSETYLKQWERFCLRRFLNEKGCSLLSSQKIVHALRDILMESRKLRTVTEVHYLERAKDVRVSLEQEGPACTIKVQVLKEDLNGCCDSRYHRLLFHGDFTLALHCSFWPDEAKDFFSEGRRQYWPPQHITEHIKKINCHVVPKSSTTSFVKMTLEQAEYTSYAQNSGLEWRYSFSQAEIFLSDNIPKDARTAFLAFKALNKRHLNMKGHSTKSYALKSILFWCVEKQKPDYWERETASVVEDFFLEMLHMLQECYRKRFCPNYWIPEANLIENLTNYDCDRKIKLCQMIIKKPKEYVADNWLEYVRCLRLNCCYCGQSGVKRQYSLSGEIGDSDVKSPSACCSCSYKYDSSTCPCGPCEMNQMQFEVY